MDINLPLKGKVALVVGAGRPLGRAAALGLAKAGARLALHDLSPVHLDETAAEAAALGAGQRCYTGDVGKGLPCRALIADVLDDWQRLDVLVTCLHAAPAADLLELDEWDWTRTLELNLTAPFLLAQAAVPAMIDQGGGTLIFLQAAASADASLALTASQGGLSGLGQALVAQLAGDNIGVHVIEAGTFDGGLALDRESPDIVKLQAEIVRCCSPATVRSAGSGKPLESGS